MAVNQARVNEVAQDLQGTCKALEDFATEEECDDQGFLQALDELVFCCEECGWWSEIGDLSEKEDAQVCEDCNSE